MSREKKFFDTVASRKSVRSCVRAIVLNDGQTLVQKPNDEPDVCYVFIGGEYEVGDTFVDRLKKEFEEETTAKIIDFKCLFVVENRFRAHGKLIHSLEHYLEVTIDRSSIESKEPYSDHYWLPISSLKDYDVRPWVVRDRIAENKLYDARISIILRPESLS
jgi:ADP-ribose pyrophosphatase YjhB (NUDIX family)